MGRRPTPPPTVTVTPVPQTPEERRALIDVFARHLLDQEWERSHRRAQEKRAGADLPRR